MFIYSWAVKFMWPFVFPLLKFYFILALTKFTPYKFKMIFKISLNTNSLVVFFLFASEMVLDLNLTTNLFFHFFSVNIPF